MDDEADFGWKIISSFHLFEGFPSLCSCCPISKSQSSSSTSTSTTCSAIIHDPAAQTGTMSTSSLSPPGGSDARTSSVAELRRKAQEHSAALLHSLHAVAVSGLSFPGLHFPPLSLHHALSNRSKNGHHHHLASEYISDLSLQHNNNNNIISKVEPGDKVENNSSSSKTNSHWNCSGFYWLIKSKHLNRFNLTCKKDKYRNWKSWKDF